MEITFVNTHFTLFGGAGRVIMDCANALVNSGFKINILASKIDRIKYHFDKKINLIEIGGFLPKNPLYWLFFKNNLKKHIKLLNTLNSDIYVSQSFPTNYFCSKINKHKEFKHIHFCCEPYRFFHDKNFFLKLILPLKIMNKFYQILFKKYDIEGVQKSDLILCNSNFTKEKIKIYYNKEAIVIYPIPIVETDYMNQNNYDLKRKLKVNDDSPLLFTLGLTHHMKGTKELMYIFHNVLKKIPNTILIIGGGILKENKRIIVKLMKKLKIPKKNIIFYGFIKDKELNNFYSISILTLYTAIEEPFGLIPLESMRNGTPVIAFKSGGPCETIVNGKTGYLIENFNIHEFANKIINVIKNRSLREELSNSAIKKANKDFIFNNSIEELKKILIKTSLE